MKGSTGTCFSWPFLSSCFLRSNESLANCLTSFQELMDHGEVSWDFLTHGFIKNVSEMSHDYLGGCDHGGSNLPGIGSFLVCLHRGLMMQVFALKCSRLNFSILKKKCFKTKLEMLELLLVVPCTNLKHISVAKLLAFFMSMLVHQLIVQLNS